MEIDKIGVFEVITGIEAEQLEPKPTELIIDKLLPKGFCSIFAGTTGCNKSYLAMQMGMQIANGDSKFLGFEIQQKKLNVLYVDTEIGKDEMMRRYKRISKNLDWTGMGKFNMISKVGLLADIWDDLDIAVERFKPELIIIDCLYNSSSEKDYTKSSNIIKITGKITDLMNRSGATVLGVHHFNKGNTDTGLHKDRMSGASALQNWSEHIVLFSDTNDTLLRLMRIVKSRAIDYPNDYFGIAWNADNHFLSMKGIVRDWRKYIIGEDKKRKWESALSNISESFRTNEWVKSIQLNEKKSERTAKAWLKEIEKVGFIKNINHGEWEKTKMQFIEDIEEIAG